MMFDKYQKNATILEKGEIDILNKETDLKFWVPDNN